MSIFRAIYIVWRRGASLERVARYQATRSRLVSPYILLPSRPSMFTRPKGLGDDLGRHFHKREGALIHYPCVVLTFFQPVPAPKEIDAALE